MKSFRTMWKILVLIFMFLNCASRTWSECAYKCVYPGRPNNGLYVPPYLEEYENLDSLLFCYNMTREEYKDEFCEDLSIPWLQLVQINLPVLDYELFENDDFQTFLKNLTIINCGVTTIEDNAFENLHNLEYLYILKNNIKYIKGDQFIEPLRQLQILDLSNNNIQQFHINCHDIAGFKTFILNNNMLTILHENTFKNCERFEKVEISNSNVIEIRKNSFKEMKSLSSLDLTSNSIMTVESGAFSGLTNVSNINLRDIFKHIKNLKTDMFLGLENIHIIDFSFFNIQSIESYTFKGLKSLKFLKLDNNNISSLKAWTFSDLPELKILNLENNSIIEAEPHAFTNIPNNKVILHIIHQVCPHIKYISQGFFDGIHNVNALNLTGLNIHSIEPEAFEDITFVESLYLDNNNLEALLLHQFSKLHKLQYLTLAKNPIDFINPTAFINLTSLNILDLSFCKIKNLEENIFQNLSSLIRLNLQYNQLSHLNGGMFSALRQMRYLDISYNKFTHLNPESLFFQLNTLRKIEISGNPWSCQNLTLIREYFLHHSLIYSKTQNVSNTHVGGIQCYNNDNQRNIDIEKKTEESSTIHNNKNEHTKVILNSTTEIITKTEKGIEIYNILLIIVIVLICISLICFCYKICKKYFKTKRPTLNIVNAELKQLTNGPDSL